MANAFDRTLLALTPEDLAALVRGAVADALRESGAAPPTASAAKTVLNLPEFAAWLGVSPRSVARIVQREEVPHRMVGRHYRFIVGELEAWLAGRRTNDDGVAARVADIQRRAARRTR